MYGQKSMKTILLPYKFGMILGAYYQMMQLPLAFRFFKFLLKTDWHAFVALKTVNSIQLSGLMEYIRLQRP